MAARVRHRLGPKIPRLRKGRSEVSDRLRLAFPNWHRPDHSGKGQQNMPDRKITPLDGDGHVHVFHGAGRCCRRTACRWCCSEPANRMAGARVPWLPKCQDQESMQEWVDRLRVCARRHGRGERYLLCLLYFPSRTASWLKSLPMVRGVSC